MAPVAGRRRAEDRGERRLAVGGVGRAWRAEGSCTRAAIGVLGTLDRSTLREHSSGPWWPGPAAGDGRMRFGQKFGRQCGGGAHYRDWECCSPRGGFDARGGEASRSGWTAQRRKVCQFRRCRSSGRRPLVLHGDERTALDTAKGADARAG
ncbi:vegetative cell wall protein gp1-like [Iris pallida]|uniref:Vegetative cell wall protein gp1-like n=1 Tax=Iris pallida TaxID=29817 RepID=A0AAX6GAL7_IRIPA|nr:vegetative cell wall protein gp1-like [Iris pallida]